MQQEKKTTQKYVTLSTKIKQSCKMSRREIYFVFKNLHIFILVAVYNFLSYKAVESVFYTLADLHVC